jgi:CRP-like cAMP-binding protein
MSEVLELLREFIHIDNPVVIDELEKISTVSKVPKGQLLLAIGEVQSKIYLLVSGVVRCYFLDESGAEITDCFINQRGYTVMMENFTHPSLDAIEALTDVEVLEMPIMETVGLMNQFPEMLWEYNRMLQVALMFHWRIGKICVHYTAAQKYHWFRENWEGVDAVAKNTQVASFLGITPETLSRMRRSEKAASEPSDIMVASKSSWSFDQLRQALEREGKQDGMSSPAIPS